MAGENEQFTTAFGVITSVAGTIYGVLVGDQIYEGQDPQALAPVLGNTVLVDWLPSANQWLIVAVL